MEEEEAHRGWKRRNETVKDLSSWFCKLSTQERLQVSAHCWSPCETRKDERGRTRFRCSVWVVVCLVALLPWAPNRPRQRASELPRRTGGWFTGYLAWKEPAVLVVLCRPVWVEISSSHSSVDDEPLSWFWAFP